MSEAKYKCARWRCGWFGRESDLLKAPHPFEPGEEVWGCPRCHEIGYERACDEEGCWNRGDCGTPTENSYKWLCSKHYQLLSK